MKSSTLVILCAALALSVPSLAIAQSTTVDTNVGAGVTVDGNGVGVNAGASGSATTDTGGTNGTDGSGNGGAVAPGGSEAGTMGESMSCEELGSAASIEAMGKVDMSALGTATNVSVVPVAECDDTTRSALASAGGTNVSDALKSNAAVSAAVQARGATLGDVIGATVSGDTVTVYVESDNLTGDTATSN